MLPKWHFLFGAIFSLALFFLFDVNLLNSSITFLASVFIDIDHYVWYVQRKKDFSLKRSYLWYKKQVNPQRPFFHVLHTVEILTLFLVLSYFYGFFLFLFIGILFHSIFDLIEIIYKKELSAREFSLIRYFYKGKGFYL